VIRQNEIILKRIEATQTSGRSDMNYANRDKKHRPLKRADFTAYSGLSARVPPDHTRIRKAVSSAFTPRRYRALAPFVRDTVGTILDAMLAKPKGDLVADLAYDLPALTILTLLGVEAEKVAVKRWAKSRVLLTWGNVSDAEQVAHAENLVPYWNYCLAVVAARHAERMDDLPGDLVALQRDSVEITDHEIATFCYSLLTAGHETTTNLIANGLLALLRHREAWTALVADKAKIPGAIEEILRYAQSVVAWRRKVKAAISIGGLQIPEGADLLLLLLASANRDEQVFANGERFDIEREDARSHISFGYGIHFCPGSSLAKMQLQIVIEELTARVPTLRLAPNQTIDYASNTSFRAPQSILVEWDR
jgi:cytochrome P450